MTSQVHSARHHQRVGYLCSTERLVINIFLFADTSVIVVDSLENSMSLVVTDVIVTLVGEFNAIHEISLSKYLCCFWNWQEFSLLP